MEEIGQSLRKLLISVLQHPRWSIFGEIYDELYFCFLRSTQTISWRLFRDELSKDNFICRLLNRFKEYSRRTEYPRKIQKRILYSLELIKNNFEHTIDSSDDEE